MLVVALVGAAASATVVLALRETEQQGLRQSFRSAAENRIRAVKEALRAEIAWLEAFRSLLDGHHGKVAEWSSDRFVRHSCPFEAVSANISTIAYTPADAIHLDQLQLTNCKSRQPVVLPAETGWRTTFREALRSPDAVLSSPFTLQRTPAARTVVLAGRRVMYGETPLGVVWTLIDPSTLMEGALHRLASYGVHVGLIEDHLEFGPQLLAFHRSRRETGTVDAPRDLVTLDHKPEAVVDTLYLGQRKLRVFCLPVQSVIQPAATTGLPAGISLLIATALLSAFVAAQRRKSQEVERLVQLRTRELAAARDEAVQAMRLKGQFLANMSHEIRTPMNGVLGLAELLADTSLESHQRALLDHLRGSARSLLRIVNDILNLARIETGQWTLIEEEFDLVTVFDELLQSFSASAAEKGIELYHTIEESAQLRVHGDLGRLGQVLANLVGNAVKFTDVGSVELSARAEVKDGDRIRLHVRVMDTGPGIPADQQPQLFQPFTQLESGSAKRHAGTGLGLTIARQIVERMEGSIGVDSQEGAGSRFWFEVTLRRVGPSPLALECRSALRGNRVLLVGSSATLRRSVSHYLADWEMLLEHAGDWREAVEQLLAYPPDRRRLVVADLSEPAVAASVSWLAALGRLPLQVIFLVPPGAAHTLALPVPLAPGWLVRPVGLRDLCLALERKSWTTIDVEHVPPGDPDPEPPRGPRILVVEDNPVNQKVVSGLLRKLQFEVWMTSGGAEALAALHQRSFDAVLMDCQMPVLDGFETTRLIRSMEEETGTPRTPIIAVTANSMPGDRELCLEAGMDDYLAKPLRLLELEEVLGRWVRRPVSTPPVLTS